MSTPSRNGKNASEAAPQLTIGSTGFVTARRQASTRLIWPAPMPIVWRAFASTIAFDLTRRATFHASSHAALSTAVGLRCETTFHAELWSGSESESCRSRPPSIRFQSSPETGRRETGTRSSRMLGFFAK